MTFSRLTAPVVVASALLVAASASAQPAPGPGEIALAPSRFELPMRPGSSQTVVVNVISSTTSTNAKPIRLLASLGDWMMNDEGEMVFPKAGKVSNSAVPWMIYTPVEFTVQPGQTQSIRVTIDVPEDAAPGDHTAVMFVEERPPDIRSQTNKKEITFHFRLAAVFYVIVPPLTAKGAVTALEATPTPDGLVIRPTLKNEGNTRLRPVQSWQLVDAAGTVVAEQAPSEGYPVIAGAQYRPTFKVDKRLPPGEYSVRYRVDFKDGTGKVVEGRKAVTIPAAALPAKKKNK